MAVYMASTVAVALVVVATTSYDTARWLVALEVAIAILCICYVECLHVYSTT